MFKYRAFSGAYFLEFEQNTGKYGCEKTPYRTLFTQSKEKRLKLILVLVLVLKLTLLVLIPGEQRN